MKALIKYLPIEDEIDFDFSYRKEKVGELIIDSHYEWCSENGEFDTFIMSENKKPIPCKPFVVTQDIKAGDEVYIGKYSLDSCRLDARHISLPRKVIVTKISTTDLWFNYKGTIYEIEYWKCHAFKKIIGEVSPKATFVKDWEEYEVAEVFTKKDVSKWKGFKEYKYISKKTYKIKCPCCGDFK